MKTEANDPAFATSCTHPENNGWNLHQPGLTKLEYFSSLAMQSIITRGSASNFDDIVEASIILAKKLIKELSKD